MSSASAAPRRPAGIEPLLLDFLAYLELERGLSRNTLEAYRTRPAAVRRVPRPPRADARRGRPRRPRGVPVGARAGAAERPPVAPSHARTQGRVPALLLPPPAPRGRDRARPHRRAARPAQAPAPAARALARARSRGCSRSRAAPSPLALRDRALLELMYACGLRASEAIGLELADVDLEEGLLCARGKGSKERLVPIGRQAVAALRAYCAHAGVRAAGRRSARAVAAVRQPPRRRAHAPGPLQDRPGPRPQRRARRSG